jgi:Ca2+-binding EF-hand superfamily protein
MKTMFTTMLALSLSVGLAQAADGDAKPQPARPLPDSVKKYDKNGDGQLDAEERAAFQKERQAEMLKKYDKNGDGKVDETERQAMIDERRKERDAAIAKRQEELKKKEQEQPVKKDDKK